MPYKEKKGWRGAVRFTPDEGKQIRRTKLFDRKKDAKEWEDLTLAALKKAAAEKRDDLESIGPDLLIGQWADAYLDFAKASWKEKTVDEKLRAFRRLFEHSLTPNQLIVEISPIVALNHLVGIKKLTNGNTANKDRKNLVAAWNWGIRYMDLIPINPFQLVDKFAEDRHPRYVPPLEDFRLVVMAATPLQQRLLLTAYFTAARRGELWIMKWSEVDLIAGTVGLWTNKRRSGNAEYDELPMSNAFRNKLVKWKEESNDQELVFGDQFVGLMDTNNRWLNALCEKVGVKRFGYHGIRHLAGSLAIQNGANILEVQQLLRHKSITTTQRYIHRFKQTTGAVDALDQAWEQDKPVSLKKAS